LAFHLAVAALSLKLVMGYGGIVSLGHSAFFGLGGYTSAVLIDHYGWSQGWTLYISVLLGFVVGCVVSLPALRLQGVYLALVTLGVAVLFPAMVKWRKLAWLTDGARGINSIAYKDLPDWPLLPELAKNADDRAVYMYWLAVLALVGAYLVCRGIVKSRVGRSLVAIRDNQTAAAVMGVHLARTKTLVFGVSAALCALVGSLFAIGGNLASPDIRNFTLIGSITFVLVMVLGGAATLWGPIVGAIVYVYLETSTREAGAATGGGGWFSQAVDWLFGWMTGSPASFILAVVLLVMMFVAPFGIVGLLRRLAARVVHIVPPPTGGTKVPADGDEETDDEFVPADPFDPGLSTAGGDP
jgi:branched-chain amino acid transport system permease protein